jgi:hypothetical protein
MSVDNSDSLKTDRIAFKKQAGLDGGILFCPSPSPNTIEIYLMVAFVKHPRVARYLGTGLGMTRVTSYLLSEARVSPRKPWRIDSKVGILT